MMKTIMAAKSPHESSLSFSRRHFQQIIRKVTGEEDQEENEKKKNHIEEKKKITKLNNENHIEEKKKISNKDKKKSSKNGSKITKLRMAFSAAIGIGRRHRRPMKTSVVGTLFGHRRGHVHIAFQSDPKSAPILLIELAMPTANLVREMASGLVRIALECDVDIHERSSVMTVSEESQWRGYCNGKKCGFATRRRECGEKEWRVLRAVEPVTMGAGVLPDGGGPQLVVGEMMYMRARFERVVGSRDSEAFYMMNPDGNSGTELSLYLLRV